MKNLSINGQLRHNGGGGISTQCLENTQQVYSRRYVFFYISKFVFSVIIDMNEYNFLCCVFIFWVSNQKNDIDIVQKTY